MVTGRRDSACHRADEFGLAPSSDAIDRIRRDIRSVERPERGRYRKPAAEPEAIGLAGHGMAGGTSRGVEGWQAVRKDWRGGPHGKPECARRRRQPPADAKAAICRQ